MYRPQLSIRTIPGLLRPLRPPNASVDKPKPRLFTHNSQLLLVSANVPRPQLPFLHNPSGRPPGLGSLKLRYALARLITTERKASVKRLGRTTIKTMAYVGAFLILTMMMSLGVDHHKAEERSPTPRDWSFWSRWQLRVAKGSEAPGYYAHGSMNWGRIGYSFLKLVKRLEDPNIDGQGLSEQEDGGILVAGVGKTGFDIRNKSYQWKTGYFEALMGAAKASEHLEDWVRDTTRGNMVFSKDVMIGPSNPRPKPVPWGTDKAPLEENCEPAFQTPESFYMKILTTAGFTSRQRLDAALAYADWLDYKGLPDTAEEMFDWGLDIAAGALPLGANNVVDMKTGIIRDGAKGLVSENILKASTAIAVHHARKGNVSDALPVFLSVLRARRELPIPKRTEQKAQAKAAREGGAQSLDKLVAFLERWIREPPYPPEPLSGDEPPGRSAAEICEEAGIMTYIGEVIFASSSQEQGIAWTRDAVDATEGVMGLMKKGDEGVERCRECLQTGFENWKSMVRVLIKEEREKQAPGKEKQKGWLGSVWPGKDMLARWEAEEMVLEERGKTLRPLIGSFVSVDGAEGTFTYV